MTVKTMESEPISDSQLPPVDPPDDPPDDPPGEPPDDEFGDDDEEEPERYWRIDVEVTEEEWFSLVYVMLDRGLITDIGSLLCETPDGRLDGPIAMGWQLDDAFNCLGKIGYEHFLTRSLGGVAIVRQERGWWLWRRQIERIIDVY